MASLTTLASSYYVSSGGGIWNSGTLTVSKSTIENNLAISYDFYDNSYYTVASCGGGIFNGGNFQPRPVHCFRTPLLSRESAFL